MWSETIGHKKQIGQLQPLAKTGQLPHALLFSGPEGVGKKRVALGLAQELLGSEKVFKQTHPDCTVIVPDGKTIKIEAIRELKQSASLHPLEGNAKIFILDGAETMTDASANALLKILEEPTASTYFILITRAPSRLLPTIRSRCQEITFSPLPNDLIEKHLVESGKSQEAAEQLAAFAQGSLGKALTTDLDRFHAIQTELQTLQQEVSFQAIVQKSEAWAEEETDCKTALEILLFQCYEKTIHQEEKEPWLNKWLVVQRALNSLETNVNKRLLLESTLLQILMMAGDA